jgi:hypothetical protein
VPQSALSGLVRRVPVEYRVVLAFALVWLAGVAAGLPVSVPVRDNVRGLEIHFFWPLALAAGLQLALTLGLVVVSRLHNGAGGPGRWGQATTMVRLVPLVAVAVFLYFNFKAWAPLVNPVLHDRTYQRVDVALAPLLDGLVAVREAVARVAEGAPLPVDDWYGWLFFAMFFVSLGVHGLVDPAHRQRQLVLGLCLNLCIGGLAYWVAPAVGPFLFREGVNETVTEFQRGWYGAYRVVRDTGAFPEGYFSIPLGAMPSLHLAHSLLFVLFAARSARWLLVAYVPVLAWIVVEAPASAWHYLVDLPAGVVVALLSWVLATRLIGPPQEVERPGALVETAGGAGPVGPDDLTPPSRPEAPAPVPATRPDVDEPLATPAAR